MQQRDALDGLAVGAAVRSNAAPLPRELALSQRNSGSHPKICFVGLGNLPVLAPEFGEHGIGGEQVQQTLLARAFARRGYPVSMVVGDYGQPDGAVWDGIRTFRTFKEDAGIPVLRFIHPRWTSVWNACARANADVYYVSCAGIQVGLLAMFVQRHGGRVVFRIAHDADCDPAHLLIRYLRDKKLYEFGLRRAHAVLAQTEKQQASLLENYGLRSSRAAMMVDQPKEVIAFAERSVPVLWVNNIRQFKRPDVFLELSKQVPQLSFHMIGGTQPGAESLYDDVRAHAQTLSNLVFHGQVPYHEVNHYYEQARVFVNTSDTEGFPNSYLQAWARGTPVIAFFDPDHVIERERLGFAVKSVDEMAQAVRRLSQDEALWLEASQRCRAYMRHHYDEERILSPYIDVIDRARPASVQQTLR